MKTTLKVIVGSIFILGVVLLICIGLKIGPTLWAEYQNQRFINNTIKIAQEIHQSKLTEQAASAHKDPFFGKKITANFELAKTNFENKKYDEALQYYKNNRQILKKLFGSNDLSLAYCDANMATVCFAQKKDTEALASYKRAMSLAEKVLSDHNPVLAVSSRTVITLNNEGAILTNNRKLLPAIEKLKKAVNLDPDYKLARENLGIAYNNYGMEIANAAGDKREYARAIGQKNILLVLNKLWQFISGGYNWMVVPSYSFALKQFETALFYFRSNETTVENLSECIKLAGQDPDSLKERLLLGDQALGENDPQRAVAEYSEALKIDANCMQPTHAYYVPSLLSLASYYAGRGQNSKAQLTVDQALKNIDRQAAAENYMTLALLKNCSQFVPSNMLAKKEFTQLRADMTKNEFKTLSPVDQIKALYLSASGCSAKGKIAKANDIYKQMIAECNTLDDYDRNIADCLYAAAKFWDEQKQYTQAAPVLADAMEKYLRFGWRDVDFTKYLAYIERRIKSAWQPPRGIASKRTVIAYQTYRDGCLGNIEITQSSGVKSLDAAGLKALEKVDPLPVLPTGSYSPIDVQFTFDYKVEK